MAGQYFDKESALFYNYFRDYNPATGRYMQNDPIGLDGGINQFNYVDGNPLSFIDFYGLQLRSVNNTNPRRGGGATGSSVRQSLINLNINRLIRDIRKIDPSFSHQVHRPVGQRPTQSEIRDLQRILENAQNAGFCGVGAARLPNLIRNGKISMHNLNKLIPEGTPNTWVPSSSLPNGFRFNWTNSGVKFQAHGHGANPNAPAGSNSANGPTVRVKVNNRYVNTSGGTSRGTTTNMNHTHIPLVD